MALAIRPHAQELVSVVAYVLIASFSVGLGRAWSLMQGQYADTSRGQALVPGEVSRNAP